MQDTNRYQQIIGTKGALCSRCLVNPALKVSNGELICMLCTEIIYNTFKWVNGKCEAFANHSGGNFFVCAGQHLRLLIQPTVVYISMWRCYSLTLSTSGGSGDVGGGGGGRMSGGVSWCFSLGAAVVSVSVEGGTTRERETSKLHTYPRSTVISY